MPGEFGRKLEDVPAWVVSAIQAAYAKGAQDAAEAAKKAFEVRLAKASQSSKASLPYSARLVGASDWFKRTQK